MERERTSILDAADVKFINANTVQLFKMSMDGLGTYNRSTGFVTGDVKGEWDSYALTQDRGRAFIIDSMDNEGNNRHGFRQTGWRVYSAQGCA